MYWKSSVLVIANRTATSPELLEALRARSDRGPVTFTILVPTPRFEREEAWSEVEGAVDRLRASGVEVSARLGDADPCLAVKETWNPAEFDEVIVSTFPTQASRWLLIDLPHRVAKLTGATVTHVVASDRALALR
jgi:hypothetical protein